MMKIFSVYDCKAEAYMNPWLSDTAATAVRSVSRAAMDPATSIGQHPADYTLFEIAEFDQCTGVITPHSVHYNHGTVLTMVSAAATAGSAPSAVG